MNSNNYNSLDLEGDSVLDKNKNININTTLNLDQVGNKKIFEERDSIQSASTPATGASTPQKGIFSLLLINQFFQNIKIIIIIIIIIYFNR